MKSELLLRLGFPERVYKEFQMLFRSALVVDDEPLIRMDAADIIADAGFSIIEAKTGDEALAILEADNDIDLVFTDIQMPGAINGLDLATQIDKRWPEICVIVASGAVKPIADQIPDKAVFVPKPFSPDAIHAAISEVCDAYQPV